MTLRKYSAAKVSTTQKFSASANNFRALARQRVSVNITQAGDPAPPPPPSVYLWAWGQNIYGALGLGNTTYYSSPKQVGTLTTWTTLNKGGSYNFAAIKTNGTIWSWGQNTNGKLGLGDTIDKSSPTQIGALTNWLSISLGDTSAAIKTDGSLWVWGQNNSGRLGLNTTTYYSSPVQLGALTNWSKVNPSNGNFIAAIKTDGTLWTWGTGTNGQLGLNNTTRYSSPKQVGSSTDWLNIASCSNAALAIKTDGTMWSWGYNYYGALGLGNTTNQSSPVQVGALTTWSKVAAGRNSSAIAIKTDGTLWSWGLNNNGQMGDGSTTNKSSPVQIGALTNWLSIAGGNYHNAAIKTNGTLWVWGNNEKGQLGDGTTTNRSSPIQVGALTSWLNVAAAYNTIFAIG